MTKRELVKVFGLAPVVISGAFTIYYNLSLFYLVILIMGIVVGSVVLGSWEDIYWWNYNRKCKLKKK